MKNRNNIFALIALVSIIFLGGGILKFKENKLLLNEQQESELSFFLEDSKVQEIPSKGSGYYFDRDKSSCTNNAIAEWDSISWSPNIKVQDNNNERVSCNLYFTKTYREGILNGTDPVLKEDLIPVTLEDNGTVRKANLTTPWYSYENKKWANAVILQNSYDALNAEGKVIGATKSDSYVSFDGVDDYIDLGLENYDFGTSLTVALNVRILNNETDDTTMLITNFENGGFSLEYYDDVVRLSIAKNAGSSYVTSYKYNFKKGEFFLIVAKYDGTNIYLYVNGELLGTVSCTGSLTSTIMPLILGANPNANHTFSQFGNIDIKQVALYHRALPAEEIKNNMSDDIKVTNREGLLRFVDFTGKKNYQDNEVIPEDVIESYFVWIPKYRYKLWDLGNYDGLTTLDSTKVHTIDILFGDYNTSDDKIKECTTPMQSGESGQCKVGDYMTHPSFLSIPSTGFWVGKFETGYKGAVNKSQAENNNVDISKIEIKPDVFSWLKTQVSISFLNSYQYKRNLDSHLMKNTEWGAVAFLSHSKYGNNTKIRQNNVTAHKTGYAANIEPTCGYTGKNEECNGYCENDSCSSPYNTATGNLASTTGNIYGIYDMSGGNWEYVMAFVQNESHTILIGSNSSLTSGFSGLNYDESMITNGYSLPEAKYYDLYNTTTSSTNLKVRILGDATGELGPIFSKTYTTSVRNLSSWYDNQAVFLRLETPFLTRSGATDIGINSGIFAFDNQYGQACSSYRIILTPNLT